MATFAVIICAPITPRLAARLLLSAAAMQLAGCSSPVLVSSHVSGELGARTGLVYALPKAQVQLELLRSPADPAALKKAKQAVAVAETALEAASKERDEAAAAAQEAAGIAKHSTGEGRVQALALSDMARARLLLRENELAVAKAAKKFADANQANAALQPHDFEQSATLTLLPPVPDRQQRYVVQLDKQAPTRDQIIKLGLNNGLLHSSGVSSSVSVWPTHLESARPVCKDHVHLAIDGHDDNRQDG